jgi:hypothetical protein
MALPNVQVVGVTDVGGDAFQLVATVEGVLDETGNPRPVVVRGWKSAITHFYPLASYDPQTGNLLPGAVARRMTWAERTTYLRSLVYAAAGIDVTERAGQPLDLAAL